MMTNREYRTHSHNRSTDDKFQALQMTSITRLLAQISTKVPSTSFKPVYQTMENRILVEFKRITQIDSTKQQCANSSWRYGNFTE